MNKNKSKQNTIELPKGVLKIKNGYNPNSSSIGTIIYSFPFVFIIISSIIAILAALTKDKKIKKGK